jgi:nitrogen regulatory protein P-II 1
MKLLTAIVQPPKYQAIVSALAKIGTTRLTVCDAIGYARQRGQTPTYRGNEYEVQFLRKTYVEIALNDDMVERTLWTIEDAARTGTEGCIGDGKIFLIPIDEAIDIGTERRGPEAV